MIVKPDFARRIDLPGPGPCPRPVDIDRSTTKFSKLVSLRVYSFAKDMVIDGEAEEDEVFIVLMRGQADIAVTVAHAKIGDFPLRTDGGDRAIYLPPHAAYQLAATEDCDIAYARAEPSGVELPEPRGFTPDGSRLEVSDYALGMALAFTVVGAGEALALDASGDIPRERFLHIRYYGDGAASLAGEKLWDWDSATLRPGETTNLEVERGAADILVISASTRAGDDNRRAYQRSRPSS